MYGEAILVSDVTTGEKMVIKHIDLGKLTEQEVQAAMSEVEALRFLEHPNIVKFRDSWTSDSVRTSQGCMASLKYLVPRAKESVSVPASLNILMDHADGGSLDKLLALNPSPLEEELLQMWLAQLVYAVDHMHSLGVLHRDIKVRAPSR